jgi:hypothetical protein
LVHKSVELSVKGLMAEEGPSSPDTRAMALHACLWLEKCGGSLAQVELERELRRLLSPCSLERVPASAGDAEPVTEAGRASTCTRSGGAGLAHVHAAQLLVRLCAHDHQIDVTHGVLRAQAEREARRDLLALLSPEDEARACAMSTTGPSGDGRAPAACFRKRQVQLWRMLVCALGWSDFAQVFSAPLLAAAVQGEADLGQAAVAAEALAALLCLDHSSVDDERECEALCRGLLEATLAGSGELVAGLALQAVAFHCEPGAPGRQRHARAPVPRDWLLALCQDALVRDGQACGGGAGASGLVVRARAGSAGSALSKSTCLDLARILAKALSSSASRGARRSEGQEAWLRWLAAAPLAPSPCAPSLGGLDTPSLFCLLDSPSLLIQQKTARVLLVLLQAARCHAQAACLAIARAAFAEHTAAALGLPGAPLPSGAAAGPEPPCAQSAHAADSAPSQEAEGGRGQGGARAALVCLLHEAVEGGRLALLHGAGVLLHAVSSAICVAADEDESLHTREYAASVLACLPGTALDAQVLRSLVDMAVLQVGRPAPCRPRLAAVPCLLSLTWNGCRVRRRCVAGLRRGSTARWRACCCMTWPLRASSSLPTAQPINPAPSRPKPASPPPHRTPTARARARSGAGGRWMRGRRLGSCKLCGKERWARWSRPSPATPFLM